MTSDLTKTGSGSSPPSSSPNSKSSSSSSSPPPPPLCMLFPLPPLPPPVSVLGSCSALLLESVGDERSSVAPIIEPELPRPSPAAIARTGTRMLAQHAPPLPLLVFPPSELEDDDGPTDATPAEASTRTTRGAARACDTGSAPPVAPYSLFLPVLFTVPNALFLPTAAAAV